MDGFAVDYTYYIKETPPVIAARCQPPLRWGPGSTVKFPFLPKAPSVRELARKRLKEFVFYFFFSCSASPSRGVTYTVVYTSYNTMPGFAPLAFQMFFTSVVSTATFAPVPAL